MVRSLIGLGSNLGDRAAALQQAIALLAANPGIHVERVSTFVQTEPIGGPPGQAPYLNAAAILETTFTPPELLAALRQVEQQLGRTRPQRWAARTIDLDLLLCEQAIWNSADLVIPHPRLAWREFVLRPAAEIAGEWRHPLIGWTMAELLRHLRTAPNYVALSARQGPAAARLARELLLDPGGRWVKDPSPTGENFTPARPADHSPRELEVPPLEACRKQLLERAAVLDRDQTPPPAAGERHWLISDFWLPEPLYFSRAGFHPNSLHFSAMAQPMRRELERLWPRVWHPKLLVLIQAPSDPGTMESVPFALSPREPYSQIPCLVGREDQPEQVLAEVRAALGSLSAGQERN